MKCWMILVVATLRCCSVCCQPVQRFEVVMTEIMADPLPVVGLPAAEYIELKNRSKRPLRLDGCRITDGSTSGIIGSGIILPPDSLLVLCSRTFAPLFASLGRAVGLNTFPSIDNDEDEIVLLSPEGAVIHALRFEAANYRNPLKEAGGWSLEMIDPGFPCHGSDNWAASVSPVGGTPGRNNSVNGVRSDMMPPGPVRTWSVDSLTVVVLFDEGLDSLTAARTNAYTLQDGAPLVVRALAMPPFFDRVTLMFDRPLRRDIVYALTVRDLRDCQGNAISTPVVLKTGRPGPAVSGQLRINELLFNPRPGGADYVELINLGPGILDAVALQIGNAQNGGVAANLKPLDPNPRLIFPGDHIVCTTDPGAVMRDYFVRERAWLWKMSVLPSFPDDAGCVVVLDHMGRELDRFNYDEDLHFPLLGEREGVALERVRPASPTASPGNWHSASSTSGYGTPTARNSQYMVADSLPGEVRLSNGVISPDLDGINDILTVSWRFPATGNTMSLRVLDIQGRTIRTLLRNGLSGTSGEISWNGLRDGGHPMAAGPCVLWAEVADNRGRTRVWRLPFLVAYR